jgi:hypothetical protein
MSEQNRNESKLNQPRRNDLDERELAACVQQSLAPMNRDLNRDLWPQMLRRLDLDIDKRDTNERAPGRQWLAVLFSPAALSSVPWFDWALLAVLVAAVCIFPKSIPIWLYHF